MNFFSKNNENQWILTIINRSETDHDSHIILNSIKKEKMGVRKSGKSTSILQISKNHLPDT